MKNMVGCKLNLINLGINFEIHFKEKVPGKLHYKAVNAKGRLLSRRHCSETDGRTSAMGGWNLNEVAAHFGAFKHRRT